MISKSSTQLAVLHVVFILLTAGCLVTAHYRSEQTIYFVLAGVSMLGVLGTLQDLYRQLRVDLARGG